MNHKKLHEEANSNLIPGWNCDTDRSSATQLSAIYKLLDERLPAAPMTVIESAPAPAEDSLIIPCRSDDADSILIEKWDFGEGFYIEVREGDAHSGACISHEDAKRLIARLQAG